MSLIFERERSEQFIKHLQEQLEQYSSAELPNTCLKSFIDKATYSAPPNEGGSLIMHQNMNPTGRTTNFHLINTFIY
jgi:hypothetical protein